MQTGNQFERRQAMKRRWQTAARNATATRCTVSEADTELSESSTTSDICTDEDTLTGMTSESPEETSVHSDSGGEMLLAIIQHLLRIQVELYSTKEELAKTSNELLHVKSELLATNDQLAEVKAELAEEKKVNVRKLKSK